jgi:hypothetical protein
MVTMSYREIYETLIKGNRKNSDERRESIPAKHYTNDFEFVRYGLPSGAISFKKHTSDREKLLRHFRSSGYSTFPTEIDCDLRKHVALFRASLDLWEQFSKDKVFSKDEIYYRCILEGPSFAEFIKKSRSTCLRAFSSETETEIEEEYFHDTYSGYNSIIHERYLINWDSTDEVDDIKYSFIDTNPIDEEEFRGYVKDLFDDFSIGECRAPEELDLLRELKNTKMYDPVNDKTALMRSFWGNDVSEDSSYFAKRVVVPIEAGNVRDTGIGDPATILKVKQLNGLARIISERVPYMVNCPEKIANERLKRVLKRNAFLHLDFKKFGLTFPRKLMNIVIEEIGEYLDTEVKHLLITDFVVKIDNECYKTVRGTMLGWLDSINCIAVTAILHSLIKHGGLKFDFVTFNDDVEISTRATDPGATLNLLKLAVCAKLSSFDILISVNKTYGSRASVFLERYAYYDRYYDLDMYKEQLTVKAYAQSLCTVYPWKAKMLFAAAEQWTKSKYATDRCIDTCKVEFTTDEITQPLWCGGWYITKKDGLDISLQLGSNKLNSLGILLQKWKSKNYTQEGYIAPSNAVIQNKVENLVFNASSPGLAKLEFEGIETLEEINQETISTATGAFFRLSVNYFGSDTEFTNKVLRVLEAIPGSRDWGPM